VPHEGGQRFGPDSIPARTLRAWLAEGLRDDPADLPAVTRIEVLPAGRVLVAPTRWQQLAVVAHCADGSRRDVTRLTVFGSSDPAVAEADPNGLVEFHRPGEAAILCRYLERMQAVRLTYLQPRQDFAWPKPPENNYVDTHVFAKLKMLNVLPSDLCTDHEFLRRIYLDLCGTIPTSEEARAFLADRSPDKRDRLIDRLLERPEFADYWTFKWLDLLRSKRTTLQIKGVHVYQRWMRDHVAANTPWDRVVRELLTASGSTFANPPANYYRGTYNWTPAKSDRGWWCITRRSFRQVRSVRVIPAKGSRCHTCRRSSEVGQAAEPVAGPRYRSTTHRKYFGVRTPGPRCETTTRTSPGTPRTRPVSVRVQQVRRRLFAGSNDTRS
jgi:hypothetical protein